MTNYDAQGGFFVPEVDALRFELSALRSSLPYAYAMGHGCTIADHPYYRALRARADDLRARIAELST